MTEPYRFTPGRGPLLISIPHVGTEIPDALLATMAPAAAVMADTDWHVDRLYDFAGELGASVLAARYSRYAIDLNRDPDPDNKVLYPGASNTELCPTSTFDEEPLYPGDGPLAEEVARRCDAYWRPYHAKLAAEIARIRAEQGLCILWEAHSIRSLVPRFFAGRLPDLNFGTGGGITASPSLIERLQAVAAAAEGFTYVVNGRFKGGYITRAYGEPVESVHAVQLELAQVTYMDEAPPFAYDPARAAKLKAVLRSLLEAVLVWAKQQRR